MVLIKVLRISRQDFLQAVKLTKHFDSSLRSQVIIIIILLYTVTQKTSHVVYCLYLFQILTDFKNSFTGTLTGQFAITASLHYLVKYKCKKCKKNLKKNNNNRRVGKRKTLKTKIAVNDCDTL